MRAFRFAGSAVVLFFSVSNATGQELRFPNQPELAFPNALAGRLDEDEEQKLRHKLQGTTRTDWSDILSNSSRDSYGIDSLRPSSVDMPLLTPPPAVLPVSDTFTPSVEAAAANSGAAFSAEAATPIFADAVLRATRIFAGPTQYPPAEFAAYGIIAFPSLATPADRERHLMICRAYVATLPIPSDIRVPRSEQMVTVWPVTRDAEGDRLTPMVPPAAACDDAIDGYSLPAGQRALRMAEQAGHAPHQGRGPYLLAWSPGSMLGRHDVSVLRADMSRVETYDEAGRIFRRWINDIEGNRELWPPGRGWNIARLRELVGNWANDMGERILSF